MTVWRDLDALVAALEDDCRRLHARYMRTRDALAAVAAWITKASPSGHHPPENYAVIILIPFILLFLALSLRTKKA